MFCMATARHLQQIKLFNRLQLATAPPKPMVQQSTHSTQGPGRAPGPPGPPRSAPGRPRPPAPAAAVASGGAAHTL